MRIITRLMIICLILLGKNMPETVLAEQLETAPITGVAVSEFGAPVSNNILDSLSGGQNIQIGDIDMLISDMDLQSELGNNTLYTTGTGSNMVSSDAFSHASGISTVIQNSGNQVIINSALILNLRIQ